MTGTQLGKIQHVRLGSGGYQDACFGISFTLGGEGWGVQDFWGTWETRSDSAKYSEEEWKESHHKTYFRLMQLMKDAKVSDLNKLKDIPVECVFDGNLLKSWRVLKEVL